VTNQALMSFGPRWVAPDTAILCALVVIGPQLFAGSFPWTVVCIAGLSLAALAGAVWVHRAQSPRVVDGLFIMMALAWLWTCVQALPMPGAIAHALRLGSIESAARLEGLSWAGTIPLTISYDPGSTHLQVLTGIVVLSTFLAARLGGPSGLRPIAAATVTSALLLGFEALLHWAADADAVFGVYVPRFAVPHLLGPLMNGNHLGGFSLMGALIAAGLAAQTRGRARSTWTIASVLCSTTVVLTLSRGAIGALLFGFMLLAGLTVRSGRSSHRRLVIPIALSGAVVAGIVSFVGLEPVLRRFETQGFDKVAVAARGFRLLDSSNWWLGIGRGAFSSAFVAEEGSRARYTHPENIVVQWTTEWGLLVALGLILVLAAALWKRLRTSEEPLVGAVCVAVLALSLQNLVDFSLEMAGVAVVAATLLGALLPPSPAWPSARLVRLPVAVLFAFTVMLMMLGPHVLGTDTQSIVDRLTRAMDSDDEADFRTTLRRGLSRHPGEPTFALLAGTYAGLTGHPDAPRWLSVVMDEAPGWAAPHVVASRLLFEKGQVDQALLEIREAEQRHAGSAQSMLCQVLTRGPSMEHVKRAAPSMELRVSYLDRAATCPGLPGELRAAIDAAILQSEPTRSSAVMREARRLVSQQRSAEATALIEQAVAHNPDNPTLWSATIRAHLHDGDADAAQSALNDARARGIESRTLTESEARVQAALGQADAMRLTLTRLRGQARGDATLIGRSFMLEGKLEASLGNIDEALAAYAAADAANPELPALEYAAALALKSGRRTHASRIYRTLCAREPGGPACAPPTPPTQEPGGVMREPAMP